MECKYTITGNLFSEIVLHARELLSILRMCECRGVALDDITLVIHSFNNAVCRVENTDHPDFYAGISSDQI